MRRWLSKIIVNESRRYIAARAKQGTVLDIDDYLDDIVENDIEFLPSEYVEDKSVRHAIMEVVSRLPSRQREAIILHYYDELKVTEVAQVMGIPHQSASRYLSLARQKLMIELNNNETVKHLHSNRMDLGNNNKAAKQYHREVS